MDLFSFRRSTPSKTHKSDPVRREGPKVGTTAGSCCCKRNGGMSLQ